MRTLKRLLFRLFLKIKNAFYPTTPITDEERTSSEICFKLLNSEESQLYFAPISEKRFIKSVENDMYITIETRNINIINHVYSYNVFIESDDLYDRIVKKFDYTLEKQRDVLEEEIRNNIKHSLTKVLESLDQ